MELKSLKKGFFGFNKNSVFEYISELNRICSEKIEETKKEKLSALADLSKKNEELNGKVVCLESEIDALKIQIAEKDALTEKLKSENEQLKNSADVQKSVEAQVADILTEANRFSQTLHEKAIKENEKLMAENLKTNMAERERLTQYGNEISAVKAVINSVLSGTLASLKKAEKEIAVLESKDDE